MNIKSVSQFGAVQDVAHQSAFVYGVNREHLPPRSPSAPHYVTLPGRGHMETVYQFRQVEGWLGDVPVSFTFLTAQRSYEYTKQIFADWDRRAAVSTTNSWVI